MSEEPISAGTGVWMVTGYAVATLTVSLWALKRWKKSKTVELSDALLS